MNRRDFLFYFGLSIATTGRIKNAQAIALGKQAIHEYSLKERAAAKGLFYGAFAQGGYKNFLEDQQFQSSFIENCSFLTVGFYSGNIRPSDDTFDFSNTDLLAKFALDKQIKFRGHPLVWHNVNPEWLISKFKNSNTTNKEIENILINHVSTVVKRYAGQVHSWDVVNEAINISDRQINGLRDTTKSGVKGDKYPTWFNFLGENYIDLAFRTAAEADPEAMLVYNDFDLDYDTPEQEKRRIAVLDLLYRLISRGTPVHALGIQAHLQGDETRFNPSKMLNFLGNVGSLGLKIIITELDVADNKLPKDIEIRDRLVAKAYEQYLSAVLQEPAVIGVITWGLSDRYTWLSSYKPRTDGAPVRPLPLDANLKPKPAWYAIARALENAPQRPSFRQRSKNM
jgi:endo-1,4-beta-xylanase